MQISSPHRCARRAMPVADETCPFQQFTGDHPVELLVVDEEARDRLPHLASAVLGSHRHRRPKLRVILANPRENGALRPRGPGEHGQLRPVADDARPRTGRRGCPRPLIAEVGESSPPNSVSSAARWLAPRPPTRRDSAMPSRSIICLARTLPPPGIDSRRAETFIFPITSSDLPSLSTWGSVVEPRLRRFLTSARSLRALAAFSRAAARCSGVRGGRATPVHLGFRIEKLASGGETSEFTAPGPTQTLCHLLPMTTICSRSDTICHVQEAETTPSTGLPG